MVENTPKNVRGFELVLKVPDDMTWSVMRAGHRVWDSASLTSSRRSITSVALSPVNCRSLLRWVSSTNASSNLSANSSGSKSPASSRFALGMERMRSNIQQGGRAKGRYSDIHKQICRARRGLLEVEVGGIVQEWTGQPWGQGVVEDGIQSTVSIAHPQPKSAVRQPGAERPHVDSQHRQAQPRRSPVNAPSAT